MDTEIREQLERREERMELMVKKRSRKEGEEKKEGEGRREKEEERGREGGRRGRVHAEKRRCGRGSAKEWMISHAELERIKSEGLLPLLPSQPPV